MRIENNLFDENSGILFQPKNQEYGLGSSVDFPLECINCNRLECKLCPTFLRTIGFRG